MSCDESSEAEETWVQWFCGLEGSKANEGEQGTLSLSCGGTGNSMFCEVERAYIEDAFNLYGLRQYIPNMSECLDVILDRVDSDNSDDEISATACLLYGLIHARYITTANGLETMYHKYSLHDFGHCPRLLCRGQPVVPIGLRDEPKIDSVKIYCPKCQEVYSCPSPFTGRVIDGAFFGTTFAHLFFMTFEHLIPPPCLEVYTPTIYGFRIHHSSKASSRRYREHLVFKKRLLEMPASSSSMPSVSRTRSSIAPRGELRAEGCNGKEKEEEENEMKQVDGNVGVVIEREEDQQALTSDKCIQTDDHIVKGPHENTVDDRQKVNNEVVSNDQKRRYSKRRRMEVELL